LNWWLPNKRKQEVPAFLLFWLYIYIYIDKKEIQNHKCWNPGFFEILSSQDWTKISEKSSDFYALFKQVVKNMEGCLNFFYFHIWAYSQIWLNLPMNDCHFGYITKLTKKRLVGSWEPKYFFSFFFLENFTHGDNKGQRLSQSISGGKIPPNSSHF
jgi:hypothetical protein